MPQHKTKSFLKIWIMFEVIDGEVLKSSKLNP